MARYVYSASTFKIKAEELSMNADEAVVSHGCFKVWDTLKMLGCDSDLSFSIE